jgi:hypothetical protein
MERKEETATNGTARLLHRLIAKRRARIRGVALLPGVVALLFLDHAIEDAGLIGAIPYIVIPVLSAFYAVRPALICWAPLFTAFLVYGTLVAIHPESGPPEEWMIFMLLGFVPALLVWFARPRETVS